MKIIVITPAKLGVRVRIPASAGMISARALLYGSPLKRE